MQNHTAYLSIGSNIGDRLSTIESAVAAIESRLGVAVRRSRPFESEPWGYDSSNTFVNLSIAFETALAPDVLHEILQEIEHGIDASPHRDMAGNYADRRIDIDFIAMDEIVIDSERLTLPHPRMHLRRFVLTPMAELAPGWRHPVLGLTCDEMTELAQ